MPSNGRLKVIGALTLLVLLGLTTLVVWRLLPVLRVPDSVQLTPAKAAGGPPAPVKDDPLGLVEEEIARRLEAGQAIKDDQDLFQRLRSTIPPDARHTPPLSYPARLWFLFFSEQVRAGISEWLRPSARDREAFAYLTSTLPASWSLRASAVVRGAHGPLRARLQRRDSVPAALRETLDTAIKIKLRRSPEPWQGVKLLLLGDYTEQRGERLSRLVLEMARQHLGDLRGKDMADVGAGCGPTLEQLRQAVGPEGTVTAVEIDPFMAHVLRTLHRDRGVQVLLGTMTDSRLPPGSLDLITMNGVHLGAGLKGNAYQNRTLPWLKTLARALRPGGLMIIEDNVLELLQQQVSPKVERAGFKTLVLRQGSKDGLDPDQWLAVFKR